ncbi:protein NIM1-INTERACTING 1-like [Pyrus communis]|uniref:protein NIM1-INTERACTING 1-like n=1 Tax=Pyrus communis TaxID=23211 RepID=UPI0035BF8AAF
METCKESNKRKMINSNVDDDEEEKIELFFALINNIRVARDRLMNGSNVSKGSEIHESVSTKKNKRKVVEGDEEEKTTAGVWKPTFQPEDLTEVATQSKIPHIISGGSKREHCKKGDLDLRLSL